MTREAYEKARAKNRALYHHPDALDEDGLTCGALENGEVDCDNEAHFSLRAFRYDSRYGWVTT